MLDSPVKDQTSIMKIKRKQSLTLLKASALKLDLSTPLLVLQKLIKKKEVRPISSQPKKIVNKLSASTRHNILKINQFTKSRNESSLASYLK